VTVAGAFVAAVGLFVVAVTIDELVAAVAGPDGACDAAVVGLEGVVGVAA
jgi:hypothetical protein